MSQAATSRRLRNRIWAGLEQAWAGFLLPARILRHGLRDPAICRRFIRTTLTQLGIVVAIVSLTAPAAFYALSQARADGVHIRFSFAGLAFLSTLYATLCTVEWIVVALFRDYNDVMIRDLCLAAQLPSESAPERPRIRFDLRWACRMLGRKVGGAVLFASILPFLIVCAVTPAIGGPLKTAMGAGWGLYWVAVLTAGKSPLAWCPCAGDPFYLRGIQRVPGVRRYTRLWRRLTRKVQPAALTLEEAPWTFAGLVGARTLAGLPLASLFLRPLIAVAATHVIHHTRAEYEEGPGCLGAVNDSKRRTSWEMGPAESSA